MEYWYDMETKTKHIHRFVRVSGKFVLVWKCADPDCTYLVNAVQEYHIIGKSSLCWGCGQKFTLDEDAMQLDQPMCASCRNPEIAPIQEVMDKAEENFPMNENLAAEEMRKKLIEMGILPDKS